MNRIACRCGKLAGLLVALIVLYTGLLLAAYSFPDEWIDGKVKTAVNAIDSEINY